MLRNDALNFSDLWHSLGLKVEGEKDYDLVLRVEDITPFDVNLSYASGYLFFNPDYSLDFEGCIMGLTHDDRLCLSLNLSDDVCVGKDWAELAANLPTGMAEYTELTEANFGWMQQLLNLAAGLPTTTKFQVVATT